MEHFNPLLLHNDSPAKFITIAHDFLPPGSNCILMSFIV